MKSASEDSIFTPVHAYPTLVQPEQVHITIVNRDEAPLIEGGRGFIPQQQGGSFPYYISFFYQNFVI